MNILFFLTPKEETAYIYDDDSLRQALEKMEYHKYSALPIIRHNGKYVGTITEGDLLWYLKKQLNFHIELKTIEKIFIMELERLRDNMPVRVDTDMEGLMIKAMSQNFIPVVDDDGIFIGIVTRKSLMNYLYNKSLKK